MMCYPFVNKKMSRNLRRHNIQCVIIIMELTHVRDAFLDIPPSLVSSVLAPWYLIREAP